MYKRLFLLVGIAILSVLLWSLAGKGKSTSYEEAEELLLFRRIGHEFLLSAGDTKSRVLPVKKISDSEFRVEFENPFAFQTDSLVSVVGRILNPLRQPMKYMVNVTDEVTREVIYNFSFPAKKEDIPCEGRPQPAGRYAVNILLASSPDQFQVKGILPLAGAALLTTCLVFFGWRFIKNKKEIAQVGNSAGPVGVTFIPIGKFRFYPGRHLLHFDEVVIELTAKETKLLRIFSEAPNEVIDRNRLLKEGWEDEGVITGRSLDMYVSKLRKKLQADPAVGIINVHGRGYRLNC